VRAIGVLGEDWRKTGRRRRRRQAKEDSSVFGVCCGGGMGRVFVRDGERGKQRGQEIFREGMGARIQRRPMRMDGADELRVGC
jgi:hypothetical protein